MKKKELGNVNKITKLSGVGLNLSGEGKMKDRRYWKEWNAEWQIFVC